MLLLLLLRQVTFWCVGGRELSSERCWPQGAHDKIRAKEKSQQQLQQCSSGHQGEVLG